MSLYFSLKVADGILSHWGWNYWRGAFSEIQTMETQCFTSHMNLLAMLHVKSSMLNESKKSNLNCWFGMTLCFWKWKNKHGITCSVLAHVVSYAFWILARLAIVVANLPVHRHLSTSTWKTGTWLVQGKSNDFETCWQVGLQGLRFLRALASFPSAQITPRSCPMEWSCHGHVTMNSRWTQ